MHTERPRRDAIGSVAACFVLRAMHVCQVTEELRFGTDEAPKARDAVVMQVRYHLWCFFLPERRLSRTAELRGSSSIKLYCSPDRRF